MHNSKMVPGVRIGLLYIEDSELNQSIREQMLGARLAADYTRDSWPSSASKFEIIEGKVTSAPSSIDLAARELVYKARCKALMGALTVPLSIQAAEWAEAEHILYLTSNNNPRVGDGRRCVFHIGVPSEMTGKAVANYLKGERKSRVYLLHTAHDFQKHATYCMAKATVENKISVAYSEVAEDPARDKELLERVRAWRPDAVCILGSETARLAELVRTAYNLGGLPYTLYTRGMLSREFANLTGNASEGHEFTDLYLRNGLASEEEKALHLYLARANSSLVATANNGFGWDCLRLLAETWRTAGPGADRQVEFLESLQGYSGATGMLTFSAQDHNGRKLHDPTTISRLVKGRFIVVNTLMR